MAAAIKRLVTKVTAAKETAPSPLKRHYLRLAVYNVWANEVLWEKASVIPLTEYVADKKLFFKSIHGTMNRAFCFIHLNFCTRANLAGNLSVVACLLFGLGY
jgi:hypothetical protein